MSNKPLFAKETKQSARVVHFSVIQQIHMTVHVEFLNWCDVCFRGEWSDDVTRLGARIYIYIYICVTICSFELGCSAVGIAYQNRFDFWEVISMTMKFKTPFNTIRGHHELVSLGLSGDHLGWNEWVPYPRPFGVYGLRCTFLVEMNGSVPTSLGEWIHSPWVDLGLVVWKGYRPRVRLVLALGHASAWFSPFWRGPAPGAQRYQAAIWCRGGPWVGPKYTVQLSRQTTSCHCYGSDREWRTILEEVSTGHRTEIKASAHTGSHCSISFAQSGASSHGKQLLSVLHR